MRTKASSQAFWAERLLDALHTAGIREVVLSPGSRSTPFVLAALAHGQLRVHDVVDERVAGFHALGIARSTGTPTLLLCTSGTAPAHYYPAVIEASASFVPLVVLSADRPIDLHGCGANQAVDQTRLFGSHVRMFVDVGAAADEERAIRAVMRSAVQAVGASLYPVPGAVQINARADKPLEPPLEEGEDERVEADALRRKVGRPTALHSPEIVPSSVAVDELEAMVRNGRGVILAGPMHPMEELERDSIFRLAARAGAPILAEVASQLRFGAPSDACVVASVDALLRSQPASLTPDFVIQLGGSPVTRGALALLERHRGGLAVVTPYGFPDPESRADHVVLAPTGATMRALLDRLEAPLDRGRWLEAYARADHLAWAAASALLEDLGDTLTEASVARDFVEWLPPRAWLALGNSLPIRHVDAWAARSTAARRVLTQRGASGIDGMVSASAGVVAATADPVGLLVGDLTFLHDVSGLAVAAKAQAPLVIVVVANGGGRIFEQLPVARHTPEALPHFVTPLHVDLCAISHAYGVDYARVSTRAELRSVLEAGFARDGCTVVEAEVPHHSAAPTHHRLLDAVRAALSEDAMLSGELGA